MSARDLGAPESAAALETLCRTYWYPLYAFIRRQGQAPADAQDLTQEFFARLLQKDYLRTAAPEKGRFRTFLLVALKRFMANEWDRARALKRGGGQVPLPLDTAVGETRYQCEPPAVFSADQIYERRWAMILLDQTMTRLRQEYADAGKTVEFEHLKSFLTVERGEISYPAIAESMRISEGAARVAVHRLRKRFREVFRQQIAQTVQTPEEIEDEVRHLVAALAAEQEQSGHNPCG